MYQKSVSPFQVGIGILLLFLMGLDSLDGEIRGMLFGKHSPSDAVHSSQEIWIVVFGWVLIATAILLAVQWLRGLFKR